MTENLINCNCNTKHYHGAIETTPEHITNYKGESGFFIKKFLISDSFNLNSWRVTWEAIKKDLTSFIGTPVVLTPERDHPSVKSQNNYKVGEIIDVGYDDITHKAWQVSQITDKNTQQLIKNKKIRYGSPTVHTPLNHVELRNKGTASEQTILHRFLGKHDALVAEPAYGKMIDNIPAICEGDEKQCASKLLEIQADLNDEVISQVTITPFMKKIQNITKKIHLIKLQSDVTQLELRSLNDSIK